MFNYQDLIGLFNRLFSKTTATILINGGAEPIYLPRNNDCPFNKIIFRQDYFASALHEIAHWCIAGPERRQLMDYGYWYQPDGRLPAEQKIFEQVEKKPQALEWIFSVAAGSLFYISADNLTGNRQDNAHFKALVYQQAMLYLNNGLPECAELFNQQLLIFYKREAVFSKRLFNLNDL